MVWQDSGKGDDWTGDPDRWKDGPDDRGESWKGDDPEASEGSYKDPNLPGRLDDFLVDYDATKQVPEEPDKIKDKPNKFMVGDHSKLVNQDEILHYKSLGRDLAEHALLGEVFEERLENMLVSLGIIDPREARMTSYEELPVLSMKGEENHGWTYRDPEVYHAAGRITLDNGTSLAFEAIACTSMDSNVEKLTAEWLKRREKLGEEVQVPQIWIYNTATYLQEHHPYTVEEALAQAEPTAREGLLSQLGEIAAVVDTSFTMAHPIWKFVKSDGKNMYVTDFGDTLGGIKSGNQDRALTSLGQILEPADLEQANAAYQSKKATLGTE